MNRDFSFSTAARNTIESLASPPRLEEFGPLAARFLYSLRLIAIHQRARKDPTPELAVRLGSVEIAARALSLSQALWSVWPENIHVSRFCCQFLTHDEATIAALIEAASERDRRGFEQTIEGFIRPDRHHRLWDGVLGYVAAEMRAL